MNSLSKQQRKSWETRLEYLDEVRRRGLILPPRPRYITAECPPLSEYIRQAWHVVEPATLYVHGWHIDAISEHLTAVSKGQIKNLVINMPPRHMKSLIVSVFWPTWEWITNPERRWLFASYGLSLSVRDSLKCRRIIESNWYQKAYGDRFMLTGDQNQKMRFDNDKTGYRIATSVGGLGTGEGGDRIITDDPHNILEGESEAIRESTLLWWDETMSTRGNDPKTVAKVIVMQRVHEDDLSGHVLKQGGYEHLCLPAEFEGDRRVTGIGWSDPRQEEGELLCPERFGYEELDELKLRLGPIATAGQMQQRPSPRVGGMFQLSWFQIRDDYPREMQAWVRYWDKAGAMPGKGDWTVGVLMGRDYHGRFWIVHVVRVQLPADERNRVILNTAETDRQTYGNVHIFIEQTPGDGKESAEAVVRMLAGFIVQADLVNRAKEDRAEPVSSQLRAGNVFMIRAKWNGPYLSVMTGFPTATNDDDVDGTSGAFNRLATIRPAGRGVAAPPRQEFGIAGGLR